MVKWKYHYPEICYKKFPESIFPLLIIACKPLSVTILTTNKSRPIQLVIKDPFRPLYLQCASPADKIGWIISALSLVIQKYYWVYFSWPCLKDYYYSTNEKWHRNHSVVFIFKMMFNPFYEGKKDP